MPNWCHNKVQITFKEADGVRDFLMQARLARRPEWEIPDDFPLSLMDIFPVENRHPIDCLHQWSTKWDWDIHYFEKSNRIIIVEAMTAWNPPYEVLRKLACRTNCYIHNRFNMEGIASSDVFIFEGDKVIQDANCRK